MYGYYFEIDGTDQGFQETNQMGGSHTTFTLEFGLEKDDTSGNEYYLDGRNAESTDRTNWWFLSEYNGYDTNFNNKSRINWSNGYTNWHHQVLVTDDNSVSRLYINGEVSRYGK